MAELLYPNGVVSSVNMQDAAGTSPPATLTDIDESPDSPDALWWSATITADDAEVLYNLPTPVGVINSTQTFRAHVKRRTSGVSDYDSISLYEAGTLVRDLGTFEVTSNTGQTISATWDASEVSNPANAQIKVATTTAAMDAPVGLGLDNKIVQEDTGLILVDLSSKWSGTVTTYSLQGTPPTGLSINSSTGMLTINTDTAVRQEVTTVTARAANSGGFDDQTFTLSVGSQFGISMPKNDISGLSAGNRATVLSMMETDNCWTYFRVDAYRNVLETASGVYDWNATGFKALVESVLAAGMQPHFIIHTTPAWTGQTPSSKLPSNLTLWGNFCAALMTEFRYVTKVEIWNEQNSDFADPATGTAYAPVLAAAYDAIKGVNPACTVLFGGMVGRSGGGDVDTVTFYNAAIAAGAASKMDGLNCHSYYHGVFPGSGWDDNPGAWFTPTVIKALRTEMVADGLSALKLWISETGAPTQGDSAAISQANQAALILDSYLASCVSAPWIGAVEWYSYFDRGGTVTNENFFGLVGPASGGFVPKTALATAQSILKGANPELIIDGSCLNTGPGFKNFGFGAATCSIIDQKVQVQNNAAAYSGRTIYIPVDEIGADYQIGLTFYGGTAAGIANVAWGAGSQDYFTTFSTMVTPNRNFIQLQIATNTQINNDYSRFGQFTCRKVI